MFATKKKPEDTVNPAQTAPTTPSTGPRRNAEDPHPQPPNSRPSQDETRMAGGPRANGLESTMGTNRPSRLGRTQGGSANSVLNPHLAFEGDLKYSGTITLDCEFRGSISTDDTLVIGPSGKVNAEAYAGAVEVSGKFQGNIHAKTRVKIFTGGEVHGNIETPTISMEDGVVFEGQCTRPAGVPKAPAALPASDVQRVLAGAEEVLSGSSANGDQRSNDVRSAVPSRDTELVG